MAMVDSECRFIRGSCGFRGNSHDAIIFQYTQIWSIAKEGKLFSQIAEIWRECLFLLWCLVIPHFPSNHGLWSLMVMPFLLLNKDSSIIASAGQVTEECYGQLKGRRRILLRKCESSKEEVKASTLACMVLHNICIERGEPISTKLNLTVDPITSQRRDREQIRELLQMTSCGKIRAIKPMPFVMPLLKKVFAVKESGEVC